VSVSAVCFAADSPAHWLAIEGVQPSIPQNPTTADTRTQELVPKGPNANQSLAALAGMDNVQFKPQVKHVISKELLLYFDKIRAALLNAESGEEVARLRLAALASVREESGLHQLVPYFVQFIAEKVTHTMQDCFVLRQVLELANAMIANPTLYIDPSVNYLAASILTCVIGRHLGSDGADERQAQYQLRDYAASLVGLVAKKYEHSSQHLRSRLARACLKNFLSPAMPLGVHYGALSALLALAGAEAVRQLVVPNLRAYEAVLLRDGGLEGNLEAEMVLAVVMRGLGMLAEGAPELANGHAHESRTRELERAVGGVVAGRIAALGDGRVASAVLNL
jgi:transcription initiation factor TFIID subunit 6